jgi:hypothetical protein
MNKASFIYALSFLMLSFSYTKGQTNSGNLSEEMNGIYSTNNLSHFANHHYEEITLSVDKSFQYNLRVGMLKIKIEGTWSLNYDTLTLMQNKTQRLSEIEIIESYDASIAKGNIQISVSDFKGYSMPYHVAVFSGNESFKRRECIDMTTIPMTDIESLQVSSTLISFSKYNVSDKTNNHFSIKVPKKRMMINEKWLYKNGVLFPRSLSGGFPNYYLSK